MVHDTQSAQHAHSKEHNTYIVNSNTNNAWTPPLAVDSRHVATKTLWWWEGWAHWIVFMTSLCMYYALCFVHVEHSVCHEPISVLNNIYYIYIYIIYIYIYIYIFTVVYRFHEISHAFQHTTIKMTIFCGCKNLLNIEKA